MGMGCYRRMLLTVYWKIDHLPYTYDNLCCKIASENGVLLILVVCVVERYTLSLNQSSSLTSKHFC